MRALRHIGEHRICKARCGIKNGPTGHASARYSLHTGRAQGVIYQVLSMGIHINVRIFDNTWVDMNSSMHLLHVSFCDGRYPSSITQTFGKSGTKKGAWLAHFHVRLYTVFEWYDIIYDIHEFVLELCANYSYFAVTVVAAKTYI